MMGTVLYFFFLMPLLFYNFWFFFQFFIIFLMLYFMTLNIYSFFTEISYSMGIDFFSYMLILMSFFITSLMICSSISIYLSLTCYFFMFNCLLICFFLFLFFSVLNILMMYIYFELMLIPLLILVLMWGYQPERLMSSFYLFLYTLFGSIPLLCFVMYLYLNMNLVFFDFYVLFDFNFFSNICMMIAFLIKFPMFMLHFWLPSAHVQAPVSGSMILAGLMLKVGGYGIFRFIYVNEFFFFYYSYIWFTFGILGSLYTSFICFLQGDLKCMISYSSICHMGLCLCGLLTMTHVGSWGSFLMMISHGLCSSGLFFLANCLYERLFSRSFYLSKGIIFFMPSFSLMWFLMICSNMGCPPSLNFFSEILIIYSLVFFWNNSFVLIILISFFSACFSYYMYSYCQHGLFLNFFSYSMINVREYLIGFCHLFSLLLVVLLMSLV